MSNLVENPYPIFTDTKGEPLEDGFIFIGQPGLNPMTNFQQAYWDSLRTQPANDIRTKGGYPSNSGSPGRLYTATNYSIVVQDRRGQTMYTKLNSVDYSNTVDSGVMLYADTIADIRNIVPGVDGAQISLSGGEAIGDGEVGPMYYWDATSLAVDNGSSIIKPTDVTTGGRWHWVNTNAPIVTETVTATATVTLDFKKKVFIVDSAASVTVTLPEGDFQGQELQIVKSGIGAVTVSGTGITAGDVVSSLQFSWLNSKWYTLDISVIEGQVGVLEGQVDTVTSFLANAAVRNWSSSEYSSEYYEDVAYSETLDRFVAVGRGSVTGNNCITSSVDGLAWTAQIYDSNADLFGVTFSESLGMFVAVGNGTAANLSYSYDGLSWVKTFESGVFLSSVTFSESLGMFVAVGQNTTTGYIKYSYNGTSWVTLTKANTSISSVTFSESLGMFVAIGTGGYLSANNVLYSYNGIDWLGYRYVPDYYPDSGWVDISFSESLGIFVIVGGRNGNNNLGYSYDGLSWTKVVPPYFDALSCVAFSERLGMFVAGTVGDTRPDLIYSSDGITWAAETAGISIGSSPKGMNIRAITSSEKRGVFVGVGSTYNYRTF